MFVCALLLALGAGALLAVGPLAPVAAADTGNPLLYYGGPVEHSVDMVLVDWGSAVNPIFTNAATGDPGLLKYFASQSGSTDDSGGVLAQYMDSSGANAANQESYGGQFQITPTVTGPTVSDAQISSQLVSQIGSGALPAPAGNGLTTVYLVVFPPGITICDSQGCSGQAFCSYHGSTQTSSGTDLIYDVLPDDTTGAMTQGCGVESPLRNQTMYLSHELAEAINDPLVDSANAYAPPLAWYDSNCPTASSACGEVADKCNQQTTEEGGWTVQLLWSNLDGACVGSESRYGTPALTFTPPASVAPDAATTYTAAATDPTANTASASWNGASYAIASGIASITWSWGDGTPASTGASATHAFTAPGVYDVSVTATDDLGFSSTVTKPITVWGAAGAPAAQTGVATTIGRTSATVAGTLDPAGLAVGYRFDYGTSSANLAASTAVVTSAAASTTTTTVPVTGSLTKLTPGTRYYYRLDLVVGSQTIPGAVQTFTTTKAKAGSVARVASAGARRKRRRKHAPKTSRSKIRPRARTTTATARERSARITAGDAPAPTRLLLPVPATVVAGQSLTAALRRGLLVAVHCPRGCRRVDVSATLALPGTLGVVAVPRVLASGEDTAVARTGSARLRLRFSSSARAWLSTRRSASFAVSAFTG